MDTKDVAKRLVELCNAGQQQTAIETLYHDDIVSIEAHEPMKVVRGLEAVKGKGAWWFENHIVHSGQTRGPWVNDDFFVVEHSYDITVKATDTRVSMSEGALYTVKDGKIIEERFFVPG